MSPEVVLLELPDAARLPRLAAELRRLGAEPPHLADAPAGRVWLRVRRPPLLTLLRAGDGFTAFVEQVPGVWVELGYTPRQRARPAEGFILLLRRGKRRESRPVPAFRPLESADDFRVSGQSASLEAVATWKLPAPLRLGRARAEPAALWWLPGEPRQRLTALLADADDKFPGRLLFAAISAPKPGVMLVARGSGPPPVLVAPDVVAFQLGLKLPNLMVPVGFALRPNVRRDVLREALAADATVLHWVVPTRRGLTLWALAHATFQPLAEAIAYAAATPRRSSVRSFAAALAAVESFAVLAGPESNKPKVMPKVKAPPPAVPITVVRGVVPKRPAAPVPVIPPPPVGSNAALRRALTALETRFAALTGPPDDPARLELWPELARYYAALGQASDAALAWLAVLWFGAGDPRAWLAIELAEQELPAALAEALRGAPDQADLRLLAAAVATASVDADLAQRLRPQLPAFAHALTAHDTLLPVRAAWLAQAALAHLSGDALALARGRDRLLGRLLASGLHARLDAPAALHIASLSGRHVNGDDLRRLRDLAQHAVRLPDGRAAVIDLTFAYGFAVLGATGAAAPFVADVKKRLRSLNPEEAWVVRAYLHRVNQMLARQPASGAWPDDLWRGRDRLATPQTRRADRYRQVSAILEPFAAVDPYRDQRGRPDSLPVQLEALADVPDGRQLRAALVSLFQVFGSAPAVVRIVAAGLAAAVRVNEPLAGELFAKLDHALDRLREADDPFPVLDSLERVLLLAGHFGEDERIPGLLERLFRLIAPYRGERAAWLVGRLSGQAFRTLGRLGQRGQAAELADRLSAAVLEDQPLEKRLARPATNRAMFLKALVVPAAGWLYLGRDDEAFAVIEQLRQLLRASDERVEVKVVLARAYADTLGRASLERAWPLLEELVTVVPQFEATATSNAGYLIAAEQVIESVVLGLTREETSGGRALRRWLDDDEFLVRRRIHSDTAAALAGG